MNMGSKLPDKPGFTLVKAQTSFTIKYNAMNRGQLLLSLPWKKHTRVSNRNNFPAGIENLPYRNVKEIGALAAL